MFKVVKRYYDFGIYSKENVKIFVVVNRLTTEEYEAITGEAYVA
jgi:phage uncharacterized protein, XkdX family